MGVEEREENRRYDETVRDDSKKLESRVLEDPVRVLNRKEPVHAAPTDRLQDAVARMVDGRQGCIVVVDDGRIVGIFTERDALTRVLAKNAAVTDLTVADVMTPNPDSLTLDDTLGYALHKMSVGGFRHVPVVDENGAPAGVISQREAVQYLVGFFPEAIINQPPRSVAERPPRNQYGG